MNIRKTANHNGFATLFQLDMTNWKDETVSEVLSQSYWPESTYMCPFYLLLMYEGLDLCGMLSMGCRHGLYKKVSDKTL